MSSGKILRIAQAPPVEESKPETNFLKVNRKRADIRGKSKLKTCLIIIILLTAIAALIAGASVGISFALKPRQIAKKSINETCSSANDCNTNKGLECVNSLCNCNIDYNFNGDSCEMKTIGRSCSVLNACKIGYNLECINLTCQCNSIMFWNENNCTNKKTNGSSCSNTTECQNYNGLECISGQCLCGSEKYWNGTSCVNKKVNGTCSSAYECNEIKDVKCLSGLCSCEPKNFYNGSICAPKLSYNLPCDPNNQCDNTIGLSCQSSVCECNSPTSAWNLTNCSECYAYNFTQAPLIVSTINVTWIHNIIEVYINQSYFYYLPDYSTSKVNMINENFQLIRSTSAVNEPYYITNSGSHIYISAGRHSLVILDFFLTVKSTLFNNITFRGIQFDANTDRLYVNSATNSSIFIFNVLNGTSLTLIETISTQPSPQDLIINLNRIYMGDRNGNIHIFNKTNNALIESLNNVCPSATVVDSVKFDWCNGALMYTCRADNLFRYVYRDGSNRTISTNENPRVLFFDYKKRFWINDGTTLLIYN